MQVANGPLPRERMRRMARASGKPATCFAWPKNNRGFYIHCFSANGLIRCCGHGLLATAYVLHRRTAQSVDLFLPQESVPLRAEWQDDAMWLMLPRLRCQPVPVPRWVEEAFSHRPVRAACAGDEQSYLVLEYGDEVPLAAIAIDHKVITASTGRAVVICQRGASGNYDFLLRYFAPQYGVDEDGVTGSAHRVVADYWAQRAGANVFRGLQCSAGGGVVKMRVKPGYIAISGRLTVV